MSNPVERQALLRQGARDDAYRNALERIVSLTMDPERDRVDVVTDVQLIAYNALYGAGS